MPEALLTCSQRELEQQRQRCWEDKAIRLDETKHFKFKLLFVLLIYLTDWLALWLACWVYPSICPLVFPSLSKITLCSVVVLKLHLEMKSYDEQQI